MSVGIVLGNALESIQALVCLQPTGMVHLRVGIRVEAILVRCDLVPQRARLLVAENDLHDALAVLDAVLPWGHDTERPQQGRSLSLLEILNQRPRDR